MIAAIYARKSNEQNGMADSEKSVARQIEHARRYAVENGWLVDEAYVFEDDAVSGAEFANRPGLVKLLSSVAPHRTPFSILVVSDLDRIGREQIETAYVMKQLDQAGVRTFSYLEQKEIALDSPIATFMMQVSAFAAEIEREKARQRTKDALVHKARAGHVTGGRTFGYDNICLTCTHPIPPGALKCCKGAHVDRRINEGQAAVVVRIYTLFASGLGLKKIAKQLNSEQAAYPTPFRRVSDKAAPPIHGWSTGTVRAILRRELYHGVFIWNKTRKRNKWGKIDHDTRTSRRPTADWMRIPMPQLQIVPTELWARVQARRAEEETNALRAANGYMMGRTPKTPTRNLLAGLATCGVCGGSLIVETSPRKRGRIPEYICYRHRHGGSCPNALRISVDEMNDAVLTAIEAHALTPEAVEHVIRLTERADLRTQQLVLEHERADVATRIKNLVAAIEHGGEVPSLVAKLRELEQRRLAITDELAGLRPVPRLEAVVLENRLAEWRRLLRGSQPQARAVLQRVLHGRIVFTPQKYGTYHFEAPTRFDRLFVGMMIPKSVWIEPRPADLAGIDPSAMYDAGEHDEDYGRLLERATRRLRGEAGNAVSRLASPRGTHHFDTDHVDTSVVDTPVVDTLVGSTVRAA